MAVNFPREFPDDELNEAFTTKRPGFREWQKSTELLFFVRNPACFDTSVFDSLMGDTDKPKADGSKRTFTTV